MRGTPFFQAIFIVAVFLLAGWPVYRLTRPAAAAAASASTVADVLPSDSQTKPAPLEVETVFAPAPADFQIKNLDQTVLTGRGPQARFTAHWVTAIPPEGVDLVIQAHWSASTDASTIATGAVPGASPAAMRVTVRFPNGRQVEKSFWAGANGTVDEVFTIPGETAPSTP